MIIEYTSLRDHPYFDYFVDPAITITEENRKQIKPLTTKSSEALWKELISSRNEHSMLLDQNDWPKQIKWKDLGEWQTDWNKKNYTRVTDVLSANVSWPNDATIYFCWSHKNIIETTWGTFALSWINFLFDDEGPILISPEKNEVFIFRDDGHLYLGNKKSVNNAIEQTGD